MMELCGIFLSLETEVRGRLKKRKSSFRETPEHHFQAKTAVKLLTLIRDSTVSRNLEKFLSSTKFDGC